VADEVCKQRLAKRNREAPEGSQTTTAEEFDAITAYFVPPAPSENFTIREYDAGAVF
jgi:hypothetical protein